jgi:hypothetical protein
VIEEPEGRFSGRQKPYREEASSLAVSSRKQLKSKGEGYASVFFDTSPALANL